MLFNLKDMQKMTLRTPDGDLGEIKTILVDVFEWMARYVVVETDGRQAPLSVRAFGMPDFNARVLPVNLTIDRIMNSPQIDLTGSFNRDIERRLSDYYEWPYYWEPDDVPNTHPGDLTAVPLIEMELEREQKEEELEEEGEPFGELIPETGTNANTDREQSHLRDVKDLFGATIHATNDNKDAGKLDDIIVMDESWSIPYLVVDTGGLLSGKKVLVAPTFVQQITGSRIDINLRSDTVHDSPGYNSIQELTDEYQSRLRDYYGK